MGSLRAGLVAWAGLVGVISAGASASLDDLHIWQDRTVQAGERYDTVSVGEPFPPISADVEFYGSAYQMQVYGESVVNVYDGAQIMDYAGPYSPSESHLWDSSVVNVYDGGYFGGGSSAYLELHGTSTLSVYGGGTACFLTARDASVINLYGGALGYGFGLGDTSTLNIYGGTTGTFLANNGLANTATLNIYGTNFVYVPEAWPPDELSTAISRLDFVGLDGQAYSLAGIPEPGTHPNIHLIPEPCTICLLGLGTIALRRRRTL